MRSFRQEDLHRALVASGLRRGDLVIVHSALFALGRIEGIGIDEIPARLYDAIRRQIGNQGTLVVPTFTFQFCRGERFDRQQSPSKGMGAFSEFVRQLPDARRSPHPMQSLAAVGPLAEVITERDTPGAFDEKGSFEALIEFDAAVLMVGCGINAVSLIHWAEERVGVPYRYHKSFTGPYRDGDSIGRRTYRMYVRDLSVDPEVRVEPVGRVLRRRAELRRLRLGTGALECCRARHFISAAVLLLQRDPRALIRRRPKDPRENVHAVQR